MRLMFSLMRCFIVSIVIVHSLVGESGLMVTTDEIMTQFNFEWFAVFLAVFLAFTPFFA